MSEKNVCVWFFFFFYFCFSCSILLSADTSLAHPYSLPGFWSRIRSYQSIWHPPPSWIMESWWSYYWTIGRFGSVPEFMLFVFPWVSILLQTTANNFHWHLWLQADYGSGCLALQSPTYQEHLCTFLSQKSQTSDPNGLVLDEEPNWSLPSVLLIILGFYSILDIGDALSLKFLVYIYRYYDKNKEN